MTSPSQQATMEPPLKKQRTSSEALPLPSSTDMSSSVTAAQTATSSEQSKDTPISMDNPMLPPAGRVVISATGFQPEKEIAVGITHFVNNENPGFQGVLKQRYTDFLVNEVMPDGTVAHLTNVKPIDVKTFKKPQTASQESVHAVSKDEKENIKIEPASSTSANGEGVKDPETKQEAVVTPKTSQAAVQVEREAEKSSLSHDESNGTEEPSSIQPSNANAAESNDFKEANNGVAGGVAADSFVIAPEDEKFLSDNLGADIKDQILMLHAQILAKPSAKAASFGSVVSAPFTNRVVRGNIHHRMKEIFKLKLDTKSTQNGEIEVFARGRDPSWNNNNSQASQKSKPNPRQQHQGQPSGKLGWEERGGQYLHFSLYKENKDTMEVLIGLTKSLHIKPKDFNFAGTKDRRAVTVQRVSVFRQLDTTLAKLNQQLWGNSALGNYKYEKHPLELGELKGNQFHITLRDCHFGDDAGLSPEARLQLGKKVVGEAVQHLQRHGFLNYFGLQRFGTFGIGTDEIGLKLLQNDFKAACDAILEYNEDALSANGTEPSDKASKDDQNRAKAIQKYRNGRPAHEVLDLMPRKFSGETAVIRHLTQRGRATDYSGAIMSIHRNLRTMYVHAYQSLVWNFAVSERWNRYGSKVMAGDLVIVDSKNAIEVKEEVDESGEVIVRAAIDDSALTRDDVYERARPLTAEEAESGKFTIFDIVLPTPGFDIEYPQNDIGDFYKEFMGSERGGKLDPANMRRSIKDFSLSGSYRKVMAALGGDCTFELKLYKDENEQFVDTDLEKLRISQGKPARPEPYSHNNRQENQRGNFDGRGGRGGGRGNRGGRGGWGGNSRYPDQHDDIAIAKARHADNPNLALWSNAGKTIPAEEAIENAAYELERASRVPSNETVSAPVIKETWVQTDPENFKKRTGVKTKKIIGDEEVDVPVSDKEPLSPSSKTDISTASRPSEVGPKRSADEISTAPPSPTQSANGKDEELNTPDDAQLIAVIVKFTLASSQYATMALRELMKAGGVKTYKPDFSGGR